jgi:hypothetical protein
VAAGAVLLAVGPVAPAREPAELSPYSLAAYLQRVAGPGARDVRVNGFYGSGHSGAWQFVAHLTWRDATGAVRGGTTNLPQLAGSEALISAAEPDRLTREQAHGWTLNAVDDVLDRLDAVSSRLAMVELEIDSSGHGDVLFCRAPASHARCETRSSSGHRVAAFRARLVDEPLSGALSVHRVRG